MAGSLPIINLNEAKFECIFGRGCDGICCQNGEPPLYAEDDDAIAANLDKFLPHLVPAARQAIEEQGYKGSHLKIGLPTLRVVEGWCVFFNKGCVLHKVGMAEGDPYQYKPAVCALFPLQRDDDGAWYVRQEGYNGEIWDLFCLKPNAMTPPAAVTLQGEIALAERYAREEKEAAAKREDRCVRAESA